MCIYDTCLVRLLLCETIMDILRRFQCVFTYYTDNVSFEMHFNFVWLQILRYL